MYKEVQYVDISLHSMIGKEGRVYRMGEESDLR